MVKSGVSKEAKEDTRMYTQVSELALKSEERERKRKRERERGREMDFRMWIFLPDVTSVLLIDNCTKKIVI